VELEDLPGLYGLAAGTGEEAVARDALLGQAGRPRPAAALVVVDQTSLARNLYLVSQVRELGVPVLVALNMSDIAASGGLRGDAAPLARGVGAPGGPTGARNGEGLDRLLAGPHRALGPGGPA